MFIKVGDRVCNPFAGAKGTVEEISGVVATVAWDDGTTAKVHIDVLEPADEWITHGEIEKMRSRGII